MADHNSLGAQPPGTEFKRCRFPGCKGIVKNGRGKKAEFHSPHCRREFHKVARKIGQMMLDGPFGCVICRAVEIRAQDVGAGFTPAQ